MVVGCLGLASFRPLNEGLVLLRLVLVDMDQVIVHLLFLVLTCRFMVQRRYLLFYHF
jgi:hypothetical protein